MSLASTDYNTANFRYLWLIRSYFRDLHTFLWLIITMPHAGFGDRKFSVWLLLRLPMLLPSSGVVRHAIRFPCSMRCSFDSTSCCRLIRSSLKHLGYRFILLGCADGSLLRFCRLWRAPVLALLTQDVFAFANFQFALCSLVRDSIGSRVFTVLSSQEKSRSVVLKVWKQHDQLTNSIITAARSCYHYLFMGSDGTTIEIRGLTLEGPRGLKVADCWLSCCSLASSSDCIISSNMISSDAANDCLRRRGLGQVGVPTDCSGPCACEFYLYSWWCVRVRPPFAEFGDVNLPRATAHNSATLLGCLAPDQTLQDDFKARQHVTGSLQVSTSAYRLYWKI